MLPTPDLPPIDFSTVYEPAEDSFFFLDVLEAERPRISRLRPLFCIEVGSGTGIITSFVGRHLVPPGSCNFVCVDVNFEACKSSLATTALNGVKRVEAMADDLGESLLPRLTHRVDLILFNPPYIVTPSEEVSVRGLSAAWAGGSHGREVIDRFLPIAARLLSTAGSFYLLLCSDNIPSDVVHCAHRLGLRGEIVEERKCGRELLCVARFWRSS